MHSCAESPFVCSAVSSHVIWYSLWYPFCFLRLSNHYFLPFRVLMVCQCETVEAPSLLWRHDKLFISIQQNWQELPDVYVEISYAPGMLQDIPICLLTVQQSKQNVSGDAAGHLLAEGKGVLWDSFAIGLQFLILLLAVSPPQNLAILVECSTWWQARQIAFKNSWVCVCFKMFLFAVTFGVLLHLHLAAETCMHATCKCLFWLESSLRTPELFT